MKKIPLALRQLIITNNRLLLEYQSELTNQIRAANIELMAIMGLAEEDGWYLDMDSMTYINKNSTVNE